MIKIYKIIILSIIIIFPLLAKAHVQHYANLNQIEFDIYRNDSHIGKHIFTFNRSEENLSVKSEINFEIKKFGVVLYKYKATGTEVFKDGKLIKFNSETNQNKKLKYVNIELVNDNDLMGNYQKSKELAIDLELSNLKDKRLELESKIESGQIDGKAGQNLVNLYKIVSAHAQWTASKLKSKVYGKSAEVLTLKGSNSEPINISWTKN